MRDKFAGWHERLLANAHERRIIRVNAARNSTKRADLIALLEKNGWRLKRNGAGHDIYTNGKECETVPRHRELNENLAKAIIKRRGLR